MTHASLGVDPKLEKYMAKRYSSDFGARPWAVSGTPGASAVYCSAHDLALFAMLHLKTHLPSQKQIISDSAIDTMQELTSEQYGMGWWIKKDFFGYRGLLGQGGTDDASTRLQLIPSEEIAVIVLVNTGTILPEAVVNGSKLVFRTDRDGNWEIYVMSVDGELAQLTDDPADDITPEWSPDGSKIAFSSNRAGKQHIYVMNADGSSLTQLTNSAEDDTEPSWSPDGKLIAFTSLRDGNKEIYLMNADGNNQTRLTNNPDSDAFPKWSRDGRIVFTSIRGGQTGIYVTDDSGRNTTRLIKMEAGQGTWSPDGRRVSFVATGLEKIAGHFQFQIFVSDVDGSNSRMVTTSPESTFGPCWLPDGKSIAFNVDDMGVRSNIFQIDPDGTNLKRLTAGPKIDARPAFSPDGSKLAFHSNRDGDYEIYVMNLR